MVFFDKERKSPFCLLNLESRFWARDVFFYIHPGMMLLLLRRMNDATRLQQTRFTDLLPSSQSSPIHAPQTDRKIPRARQIREKDEFAQSVFRPFPLLKYCPSHIKCSGNLTPCHGFHSHLLAGVFFFFLLLYLHAGKNIRREEVFPGKKALLF